MKILMKGQVLFFEFVLMVMSILLLGAVFTEGSVYAAETPPLVTFISDDGNVADFLLLKPLSDQYNIPFTSAIYTNAIDTNYSLTTDQLNILKATGRWEFVSHTVTHPDLTTVSDAQLDAELSQSQQWLSSKDLGDGYQYLVYPYGSLNGRVMNAAMKYYKAAFATVPGLNSTQMNPGNINRIPLGAWAATGEDNVAYYESKVDEAITNGQWLVFILHPAAVNYGHNNEELETVIKYIQAKNVPIVTINQAMGEYTLGPVHVNVTGVIVSETTKAVTAGTEFNLTATISPNDATNQAINWSSDNPDIATVDANGKVTTLKAGTATITVTAADGGQTATCNVTVTPAIVPVIGVTISETTKAVITGTVFNLTATVLPDNASNKAAIWSSNHTDIATVDANGTVTTLKAGTAAITVTTADGSQTATCSVTVTAAIVPVTGVTVSETTKDATIGQAFALTAIISPHDATNQAINWSSNHSDIATVDANGKVTTLKAGTATITVTTADGSQTATCNVTVTAALVPVTGVTVSIANKAVTIGQAFNLTATVLPDNASNKAVTWSSDRTDIATVDAAGTVTTLKAGTATITVTTAEGSQTATCDVTVTAAIVPVTGVTVNVTTKAVTAGTEFTLAATVLPDNATNKAAIWSSNHPDIATVDAAGKVTTLKAGTATITVTTEDGSQTATCDVTVTSVFVPVTGVTVSETTKAVTTGQVFILMATISPNDAMYQTMNWSSDHPDIATVNAAGKVTTLKAGTATITVTTEDGGKTATCIVTVTAAIVPVPGPIVPVPQPIVSVTGITLNVTAKAVTPSQAFDLIATVSPDNATNKAMNWSSDKGDIATVDETGKVTALKVGTATITVTTTDGSKTATCVVTVKEPIVNIGATYQCHVQNIGWQGWKTNGEMSGTSGQSYRLEGIEIKVDNRGYDIGVSYRTQIENIGWQGFKVNGEMSGTTDQSLQLEAIQIKLTGADADKCDIYYQVHAQNYGWLGWAKNGESAGTEGLGYRLEAIKIVVIPKGEPAPGTTDQPFVKNVYCSYQTHVQNIGWQEWTSKGDVSGTSGMGLRLEGLKIITSDPANLGIDYQTQVENIGWQGFKSNGEMSGTLEQSLRLEAIQIRLTGIDADKYDIYYQVHAQNYGWMGWAKNGESAGTEGFGYRLEAIKIVVVPKGSAAPGTTVQPFVKQ